MVSDLHAMIARWAQPGVVTWIGLRPARRGAMVSVEHALIGDDGLAGDHARPGKRAVTLMQAEHLAAIGAYMGHAPVAADLMRRNVVVGGLNLAGLRDREVQVGSAVLCITTLCAPCSRMEETFGAGGYAAVRGHGGWCAQVVRGGHVALGDTVRPVD